MDITTETITIPSEAVIEFLKPYIEKAGFNVSRVAETTLTPYRFDSVTASFDYLND